MEIMMEEGMGMGMAPGFRFYPTEEELLSFYLRHKLPIHHQDEEIAAEMREQIDRLIPLVDIYHHNPWDLPQLSGGQQYCGGGWSAAEQWFFFSGMQEREARGGRPKRVAGCGYWKATGTLGYVYSSSNAGRCIGEKRTMVFYTGKAPQGRKTEWKLNEYKAYHHHISDINIQQVRHELSIIRVYKKSKCLRSFDRRPIFTTINGAQQLEARRIMTTSQTNNQLIISDYNIIPPDHHQPHPAATELVAVAPPRVEYLGSTSSTDWSSSPPQETAGLDDNVWGCLQELDSQLLS